MSAFKQVVLTPKQFRSLRKLLDYVQDSEEKHYEESKLNKDNTKNHIWHDIKVLQGVLP